MTPPTPAVVVGGGIAGVACAAEVASGGVPVRVLERGRRLGGRLAVRTRRGRPIDVGAAYFVARDPGFCRVVDDWQRRGLARPWTDTFHVAGSTGIDGVVAGPVRWAARNGLRSLVEDLASALPAAVVVEHPVTVARVTVPDVGVALAPAVDGVPSRSVALAVPDPQALAVLADEDAALAAARSAAAEVPWEATLALVAEFDRRRWPDLDGVFVNESPVLTFVADDGSRRGDGAPVLVAHSTPELAAAHLTDPAAAAGVMLAALRSCLRIDGDPVDVEVLRWTFARPVVARPFPCFWDPAAGVGLAGDGWHDGPRTECAWLSGRALGRRIVESLR